MILRTDTEVTSLDVQGKSVVVGSSGERVPYETLILASGGTPRKLPIDGKDLGNIFTLRGVQDAKAIDSGKQSPFYNVVELIPCVAVTEGKRLVVIGSSFISMELVVAIQKRNLASIDVIGMETAPFELVLGKQVGAALQKVCLFALKVHCDVNVPLPVPRVQRRQIPHAVFGFEDRALEQLSLQCR